MLRGGSTNWNDLFGQRLSKKSQDCFERYRRNMVRRSSTRRIRGGMAPLDYTMTPGSTVNVYGRFPTEIATDPQSIQDLDVFYRSALSRGCGTEDSGRIVPQDMGSNKVGGSHRRRRGSRKSRKSRGGAVPATFGSVLTSMQDFGSTMGNRSYVSSTPPNTMQSVGASWSGSTEPVPFPGSPVEQAWTYKTEQMPTGLDPRAFVTALPPTPSFATWGPSVGGARRARKTRARKTRRGRRA